MKYESKNKTFSIIILLSFVSFLFLQETKGKEVQKVSFYDSLCTLYHFVQLCFFQLLTDFLDKRDSTIEEG